MNKTINSKQLDAAINKCSKEELQELYGIICCSNKLTRFATQIILGVDVDVSIEGIQKDIDRVLGTSGFMLGDDCFYESNVVEEINTYLDGLFKSVFGPLIKYQKFYEVTELLMTLFIIATSMYGPGGTSIEIHLVDLIRLYWQKILRQNQIDSSYMSYVNGWFNIPELKNHFESFGYGDFHDDLMDYNRQFIQATTPTPLGYAYIKKFTYKKPNQQIPEKREILVLCDNGTYLQGVDFKYLSEKQIDRCQKILEGYITVSSELKENIDLFLTTEDYEQMGEACRIFKKTRIVEE